MSDGRHKRAYKRLLKLGISNFETVSRTRKRQADLLRRLRLAGIDPGRYAGLVDCSPDHCGRRECARCVGSAPVGVGLTKSRLP
jgi:hypothetical protein